MLLARVITYNLALAHDSYIGLFDITLYFLFAFYALVFSFFFFVGYHPFSLGPLIYFFFNIYFPEIPILRVGKRTGDLRDFSLMRFTLWRC